MTDLAQVRRNKKATVAMRPIELDEWSPEPTKPAFDVVNSNIGRQRASANRRIRYSVLISAAAVLLRQSIERAAKKIGIGAKFQSRDHSKSV